MDSAGRGTSATFTISSNESRLRRSPADEDVEEVGVIVKDERATTRAPVGSTALNVVAALPKKMRARSGPNKSKNETAEIGVAGIGPV